MYFIGNPMQGGVQLGDGLTGDQLRDVKRRLEAGQHGGGGRQRRGPRPIVVADLLRSLDHAHAQLAARGQGDERHAQAIAAVRAQLQAALDRGVDASSQPTPFAIEATKAVLAGDRRAVKKFTEGLGGAGQQGGENTPAAPGGEKSNTGAWVALGVAAIGALGATAILASREAKGERISAKMGREMPEDGDDGAGEGDAPADGATGDDT